jgi:3-oxoacyl-[acyl-carrier protein] reductase
VRPLRFVFPAAARAAARARGETDEDDDADSANDPAERPPDLAHYSATKTMQLSIARSLAKRTAGTAVTVNSVLPGPTLTEGVRKFIAEVFPDLPPQEAERRFVKENRPTSQIQRFIRPEEIADALAFVVSGRASAMNGATLRVDGGVVRHVA